MPTETGFSFVTLLALPAALFLLLVPGFATLGLILSFGKKLPEKSALSFAEYLFWTLALSLFFDGWVSFTLAELGLFSLGAVIALSLVYSLVVFVLTFSTFNVLWKDFKTRNWKLETRNLETYILGGLLLGSLVLNYLAPHETVVGSQDSGIYYNAAANLARTGSILIKDPLLPALDEAGPRTQPQFLLGLPGKADRYLFVSQQREPGMFVKDKEAGLEKGEVIPQLFHFYPALLALGMSLFGLWGGLWVSPLLGAMGVYALYLATRRLFPARREKWVAPLAALFLLLNAVQVWFSRETLWEILGEFLVFTAVYAFTLVQGKSEVIGDRGQGTGDRETQSVSTENSSSSFILHPSSFRPNRQSSIQNLGGLGVGLSLGLICLAHAQFPFMVWPLIPYFIWMRLTRRWGTSQWLMLLSFLFLLLHTVLHIRVYALAYFEGIYHNVIGDLLRVLHLLIPVAAVAFFGLILLDAMPNQVQRLSNWVKKRWNWVALGLAALFTVYLLYSYFLRVYDLSTDGQGNYPTKYWSLSSYIGAPTTEGPERNLLRIGWYFSPPGMLLIFLGLAAITAKRLNARTGFFLALTLGVSYIFLDYNYTLEHYIYSMRRYVTATIPAFSIFAAYACIVTLPDLLEWGWRKISRLFSRRVAYASAQGGPGATIAFSVVQSSKFKVQSSESVTSDPRPPTPDPQPLPFRFAGLAFAAGLVLFLVFTGRTIFTMREYGPSEQAPGVVEQLHQLAGKFWPKDILIFVGERDQDAKLSTPMTYAFGIPSFNLTYAVKNDELGDLLRRWEKQGYHLKALLGPNGGRFAPTGFTITPTGETNIVFRQLQQLVTQKPNNAQTNVLTYGIYDVVDGTASTPGYGTGKVDSKEGWTLQMGQSDWPALVNGFYSAERDPDGTFYRWTETDGVLRLPCIAPDSGAARLTLTMSSGSTRPAALPPLSVKVFMSYNPYEEPTFNDPKRLTELATLTLKPGMQDYTVDLPAGQDKLTCGGRSSSLILTLAVDASRSWVPQEQGLGDDTRRLSIKLTRVNLAAKNSSS